jgi:hypothetical protein
MRDGEHVPAGGGDGQGWVQRGDKVMDGTEQKVMLRGIHTGGALTNALVHQPNGSPKVSD